MIFLKVHVVLFVHYLINLVSSLMNIFIDDQYILCLFNLGGTLIITYPSPDRKNKLYKQSSLEVSNFNQVTRKSMSFCSVCLRHYVKRLMHSRRLCVYGKMW